MQDRWLEAEEIVARLLQVEPECSLDDVRRRYGDRAGENGDFVEALRRAGLPETTKIHTISLTGAKA